MARGTDVARILGLFSDEGATTEKRSLSEVVWGLSGLLTNVLLNSAKRFPAPQVNVLIRCWIRKVDLRLALWARRSCTCFLLLGSSIPNQISSSGLVNRPMVTREPNYHPQTAGWHTRVEFLTKERWLAEASAVGLGSLKRAIWVLSQAWWINNNSVATTLQRNDLTCGGASSGSLVGQLLQSWRMMGKPSTDTSIPVARPSFRPSLP